MNLYFFEEATIDKVHLYLASIYDDEENYLNWLFEMQNIDLKKLDVIEDLNNSLDSNNDLFGDVKAYNGTVYDLSNIDLKNSKNINKLYQFIQSNTLKDSFFYTNQLGFSLTAGLKKDLKKIKVNVVSLKKIDTEIALQIALEYRNKINLMVSGEDIKPVIKDSNSYIEIIDKLDFLKLSENPKEALISITPENNPLLFMLSFDPDRKNFKQWLDLVKKDEYQLSISLVLTKLLKKTSSPKINQWKKRIIELDKDMKSDSDMDVDNMWKMFLWKYKNGI